MPSFGEWHYTCDRTATMEAYRAAPSGNSATCVCNGCRNFVAAGEHSFPPDFVSLLKQLGIDPTKDGEVYHLARRVPGFHYYGGWYHFIGTLEVTGDFAPVKFSDGLSASMCRAYAPRLQVLKELPVVQVEFQSENMPWVLDEDEPE